MEIKILSNVENKHLDRKEISFSVIEESSTPSREALKTELCKKLNLSPDSTIVVNVAQSFGTKQSLCVAHSYKSKESLEKSEPKHILDRIAKGKKNEETPKEQPQAEAPKGEEKKAEENAEKKSE